jgi:hypothetical protein
VLVPVQRRTPEELETEASVIRLALEEALRLSLAALLKPCKAELIQGGGFADGNPLLSSFKDERM